MERLDRTAGQAEIPSHEYLTHLTGSLTGSLTQFPAVIAIILYGSAARARATPLSDVDICVVTTPGLPTDEWESIMSYSGPAVDLVLFHDLSPSVKYRVIREGKILYLRDEKMWHRIQAGAIRQYLDIKPFIERNARRILKRPVITP